jgi:putative sigma-54 modulation protein
MDSEFTGRKVKVTLELRKMAEEGLARIEKIVGKGASAHIIFSSQKHTAAAEVTVKARHHAVIGVAEAPDLTIALRNALEKAEKQAIRRKKSLLEKKRQGGTISSVLSASTAGEELPPLVRNRVKKTAMANGKPSNGKISNGGKISGPHIVPAPESMARQSMTIEEAVKEAESRAQEVFVFRDLAGDVKVLHCAGNGIVRLIEVS